MYTRGTTRHGVHARQGSLDGGLGLGSGAQLQLDAVARASRRVTFGRFACVAQIGEHRGVSVPLVTQLHPASLFRCLSSQLEHTVFFVMT